MRGIGQTFSRLPVAGALLAGAAMMASITATGARAQTEETAFAVPRLAPRGADGIALPQPLAPSEAARIRRVFAAQARGDIPAAVRETEQLDTASPLGLSMLGHILADRYLGEHWHSTPDDLSSWLARFSDLPPAAAIYDLLCQRLPRGATPASPAPRNPDWPSKPPDPEEMAPEQAAMPRNPTLDRDVHERARAGNVGAAMRLIARTRGMTTLYSALLRGEVARILFSQNNDHEALSIASAAAGDSDGRTGLANYIAGLAAWRMDRPSLARPHFEAAAQAEMAPASLRAAASFWTARTHLRTHDPAGYVPWMQQAASEPRTFYGMLARRALGIGAGLSWNRETLGSADIDAVAATPTGLTAFALLQVGQTEAAIGEFRRVWMNSGNNPALGRSLMLVADKAGLSDLAAQLATLVQGEDGGPADFARFPVPRLHPRGGFKVDPALVYALTRLESNFDATAVSSAGARGLMQLMPDTASFITGDRSLAGPTMQRLHDPALNLELGQRYVAYLANFDTVGGNLIRLLSSYNAGPGSFSRWVEDIHDKGDPLLFIEAIGNDETRFFVQHVLAYTWIYAARLHLPAPSLDELAAGAFPRYHPLQTTGSNATVARMTRLH
jgi:soluble lytic murein transglycosylase-like protein